VRKIIIDQIIIDICFIMLPMLNHYVRKPHPRHVYTKNGDAQITHLRHHVSHYRIIGDARPDASLISIHWRCAKSERVSDYKTHMRCALSMRFTDLISSWASIALI
jgi:hypothetical protein